MRGVAWRRADRAHRAHRKHGAAVACACVFRWQLLGELLLDRTNFNVMTIYISNPDNLKLMMNLLRDSSRNVQFEAFHVFKVRPRPHRDAGGRSEQATEAWYGLRLARTVLRTSGVCGQPEQGQAHRGHPHQEPRKARGVLERLPQRPPRSVCVHESGCTVSRAARPNQRALVVRLWMCVPVPCPQMTSSLPRRRRSCSSKFKTCRIPGRSRVQTLFCGIFLEAS